jgi:DNA-binding SARP family transcriptional activator
MEFRLLGPLEVRENGRAIELGAAKQRALLAVLLLNANRVVSTDTLIESLWGERAPETAAKALQVYVSQLRKAVGRDRIVTRAPGYELVVGPDELDLDRFERLVAKEEYGEALRLWRGSPLADFAYEPFAQSEIARIEELGQACLERRIEADLAAGRHPELVGELEALVRAHPLRERLRAQLMLALYRSGRQADALDTYQAGRALLSDELGLEPDAELKDLQRAILAHDPALDLPDLPAATRVKAAAATEQAPARAREVRKTVTVLCCDVTVSGAELDPESLRHVTTRGFEALVPVLEAHGGAVERSLGGAVSAVFGVPSAHEDDAVRAVHAAAEARDRLAGLRTELEDRYAVVLGLRVGIGTGEVLAGGDDGRTSVSGGPVQVAIRLQQLAQQGEILVDEQTLRVVHTVVEVVELEDHARLVTVHPVDRARPSRSQSPMVGRERERRRLYDAFAQARDGRSCQLLTILGTPGVGKSRLVQELVDDVSDVALVARGRCLPYGEGITYWPLLEAVRDAAALDDAASPIENLDAILSLLEGVDEAELAAQRLGEVVGLSDRSSGVDDIAWAVRVFVEALAREEPLVLVFDDIHWGEPTFLDLVDSLSDRTTDSSVLLVCVARPELLEVRPQWGGGKLNATSVLLEPLSDGDSSVLLDHLAGPTEISESTRRQIVEAAGGNPLFVEEMVALLLDDHRERSTLEIPPTIQALLQARLDQLPEDEREVIEAAAVEGKVFHEASVSELTATDLAGVRDALQALARRDLVRSDKAVFSGERGYRFHHLLVRDAAYDAIPKEVRAMLHERHAAWLEANLGERALDLDEIIGYHYEQAHGYRVALGDAADATRALGRAGAERLGTAGRRAFLRSDGPAGVNLISRSVALLAADDPFRVELVPNVRVVQGLGDLSWADRVLTEAVEAAATNGDRALAAHALVQRGLLRLFTDREVLPSELFDVAERAIAVFDELGDELGLARAWRLSAQAHYLDRRSRACAEASEVALVHARRANDPFEEREIVEWLVIALLLGPAPAPQALARCMELLDERWEDPLLPAGISGSSAALAAMQGDAAEAEALIERARAAMKDADEWIWIVTFWFAFVRVWHGDAVAAENELRPAYDALKRIGETSHFSSIAHALANALYLQGRYDEAEELTRECERASRPNDIHSQTLWRSIRAKALARRGELVDARGLGREAVEFAATSDFLLAHADALSDLGEVHEIAGERQEATRALEGAIELYERKGNVLMGNASRARLAILAASSQGSVREDVNLGSQ